MLGSHVLKCWSSTQACVALSSDEAEFYGVVKGSAVGIGQRALLRDIGIDIPLRLDGFVSGYWDLREAGHRQGAALSVPHLMGAATGAQG